MDNLISLNKAISICGMRLLASEIGVSYQAIQKYQKTQTPSEKVLPISKATNWQVTPHELRPDLYPHPQDGLPEELRSAHSDSVGRRSNDRRHRVSEAKPA